MTHMERIGATLAGQERDRVPYGLVTSVFGARLADLPLADYFSQPELYVRGQRAAVALLDPDVVFTPFLFAYHAAAFGAPVGAQPQAAPNVGKPPYSTVAAALEVPLPDPYKDAGLGYLLGAARAMAAEYGGQRLLVAPLIAPVDLPILLIGMENWLDALLFDKAAAAALAEKCLEHFRGMAEAYAAAGVNMLSCPVMMANPELLDMDNLRKLALPILHQAFAFSPVPLVFHHGGNRLSGSLSLYTNLPNLAGFLLSPQDSLDAARKEAGPDCLLLGNISGPHFDAYGVDGVQRQVEALLHSMRGDQRWMLCSSGAELPWRTDPAVLEAVKQVIARSAYE
ncbi:MAG: hypothetical protein KKI09_08960 [Spirochaetes bacterium]|nr:hypothetical protein [Spirochaetota bacterium]MBU0955542.1 hypothetical protein [Spirochaetota bacterium]